MKRYLIFAIAAIVVTMVGCKKDKPNDNDGWPEAPVIDSSKIEPYTDYLIERWKTPSRHFISYYSAPIKMEIDILSYDGFPWQPFPENNEFCMYFTQTTAYDDKSAEFRKRALDVKDYYYFQNYYISTLSRDPLKYGSFDNILYNKNCYIDVVAITDFDAAHPAGSSLEDIVRVEAYTALPFIESQYTKLEQGDYHRNNIKCSLTEFNARNYDLVRSCISLTITSKPAPSDDIRLEFTYRTSDGVSLTHQLYPLRYQD